MLSNTATPIYYGEFRKAVLNGEIPVCREISLQMNLIDDLIRNPKIYYDPDAVEGIIAFAENELTLTDGSDLELLPSFKLWLEDIFGWYYIVERSVYVVDPETGTGRYRTRKYWKRLRNKQYLIVARGAAKTMYDEIVHAYYLTVDSSTTDQITTAPTMAQAEEVLSPFRTAIARAKGPLFKFLTEGSLMNTTGNKKDRMKLASTKKGIENFLTNSIVRIRPMTISKLQGLRCQVATIDEWKSVAINEDVMGAIEQGASKNSDYLIIATSSEGTVRNGVSDSISIELEEILKGEYYNPHTSIWWYKLDDISEVNNPEMWMKANPNIGKTVSYEVYQLDVERAEKAPASRNDILAKRFNLPMEGFTYYFPYEETLLHRKRSYWQMQCSLGIDLSRGDDFCAFTFLFPLPNGAFGIKTRAYISSIVYSNLMEALRIKYDIFIEEGTLVVLDGTILDMSEVYEDISEFIEHSKYDVCCMGYDPYNAQAFVEWWTRDNGNFGVVKVIQGKRTESVPLGEIKNLSEQRMLYFDEEIMKFCMGNAVVLVDNNGNKMLMKNAYDEKIDCVSAALDAFVAWKNNMDAFG